MVAFTTPPNVPFQAAGGIEVTHPRALEPQLKDFKPQVRVNVSDAWTSEAQREAALDELRRGRNPNKGGPSEAQRVAGNYLDAVGPHKNRVQEIDYSQNSAFTQRNEDLARIHTSSPWAAPNITLSDQEVQKALADKTDYKPLALETLEALLLTGVDLEAYEANLRSNPNKVKLLTEIGKAQAELIAAAVQLGKAFGDEELHVNARIETIVETLNGKSKVECDLIAHYFDKELELGSLNSKISSLREEYGLSLSAAGITDLRLDRSALLENILDGFDTPARREIIMKSLANVADRSGADNASLLGIGTMLGNFKEMFARLGSDSAQNPFYAPQALLGLSREEIEVIDKLAASREQKLPETSEVKEVSGEVTSEIIDQAVENSFKLLSQVQTLAALQNQVNSLESEEKDSKEVQKGLDLLARTLNEDLKFKDGSALIKSYLSDPREFSGKVLNAIDIQFAELYNADSESIQALRVKLDERVAKHEPNDVFKQHSRTAPQVTFEGYLHATLVTTMLPTESEAKLNKITLLTEGLTPRQLTEHANVVLIARDYQLSGDTSLLEFLREEFKFYPITEIQRVLEFANGLLDIDAHATLSGRAVANISNEAYKKFNEVLQNGYQSPLAGIPLVDFYYNTPLEVLARHGVIEGPMLAVLQGRFVSVGQQLQQSLVSPHPLTENTPNITVNTLAFAALQHHQFEQTGYVAISDQPQFESISLLTDTAEIHRLLSDPSRYPSSVEDVIRLALKGRGPLEEAVHFERVRSLYKERHGDKLEEFIKKNATHPEIKKAELSTHLKALSEIVEDALASTAVIHNDILARLTGPSKFNVKIWDAAEESLRARQLAWNAVIEHTREYLAAPTNRALLGDISFSALQQYSVTELEKEGKDLLERMIAIMPTTGDAKAQESQIEAFRAEYADLFKRVQFTPPSREEALETTSTESLEEASNARTIDSGREPVTTSSSNFVGFVPSAVIPGSPEHYAVRIGICLNDQDVGDTSGNIIRVFNEITSEIDGGKALNVLAAYCKFNGRDLIDDLEKKFNSEGTQERDPQIFEPFSRIERHCSELDQQDAARLQEEAQASFNQKKYEAESMMRASHLELYGVEALNTAEAYHYHFYSIENDQHLGPDEKANLKAEVYFRLLDTDFQKLESFVNAYRAKYGDFPEWVLEYPGLSSLLDIDRAPPVPSTGDEKQSSSAPGAEDQKPVSQELEEDLEFEPEPFMA